MPHETPHVTTPVALITAEELLAYPMPRRRCAPRLHLRDRRTVCGLAWVNNPETRRGVISLATFGETTTNDLELLKVHTIPRCIALVDPSKRYEPQASSATISDGA